jgi:hypothetical protein
MAALFGQQDQLEPVLESAKLSTASAMMHFAYQLADDW